MKLDSEKQRKMILELINSVQFRGDVVEDVFLLKQAVTSAEIENLEPKP